MWNQAYKKNCEFCIALTIRSFMVSFKSENALKSRLWNSHDFILLFNINKLKKLQSTSYKLKKTGNSKLTNHENSIIEIIVNDANF